MIAELEALRAALRLFVTPYSVKHQTEYNATGRKGPLFTSEDIKLLTDVIDELKAIG